MWKAEKLDGVDSLPPLRESQGLHSGPDLAAQYLYPLSHLASLPIHFEVNGEGALNTGSRLGFSQASWRLARKQ